MHVINPMNANSQHKSLSSIQRSGGFTLIEILVAMLILAIGVLGIAALQYKGLQYNQDAYFRTQVNMLVYDIADRMRLNSSKAAEYATNVSSYSVPPTKPTGCDETAAVSRANDLLCWKQQLWYALPPGSTADISAAANGLYTVTLSWTDRENNTHNVAYTFQP